MMEILKISFTLDFEAKYRLDLVTIENLKSIHLQDDLQINELLKSLRNIEDSKTWKVLRKIDKIRGI